jgi:hypothetical protein
MFDDTKEKRLQFPVYTMAKQSRFFVGIHGRINLGLGKNNSRKWGKNPLKIKLCWSNFTLSSSKNKV